MRAIYLNGYGRARSLPSSTSGRLAMFDDDVDEPSDSGREPLGGFIMGGGARQLSAVLGVPWRRWMGSPWND